MYRRDFKWCICRGNCSKVLVKDTHLREMFRDMQLAVSSISHAAVMPGTAVVRPVVQHVPAHIPQTVSTVLLLAEQVDSPFRRGGVVNRFRSHQLGPPCVFYYVAVEPHALVPLL